jgi:hypothetical protein
VLENMDASGASSISLADGIEAGKLSVTLSGASRPTAGSKRPTTPGARVHLVRG